MIRRIILAAAAIVLAAAGVRSEKRALGHEDLDSWKGVENYGLSRNGEWSMYAVNPQAGDGELYFRNTKSGKLVTLKRGCKPAITADGEWGVALIKAEYAKTREAKIAKKKDHELPHDSLAIINLKTLEVKKIPSVLGYKIGKDGGRWVAWTSCDTAYIKAKKLADKNGTRPLVMHDLATGAEKVLKNVKHWEFSRLGDKLALTIEKEEKDSVTVNSLGCVYLPDTSYVVIDREKEFYGKPAISYDGELIGYTCSEDTIKSGTKHARVFVGDLRRPLDSSREVILSFKDKAGNDLRANQYTELKFSRNGRRLIAGVAPVIAPDDTTIVDFEQGQLDIWRWDSPMTPPKEKDLLEEIRTHNLPVAVDLKSLNGVLLSDNMLETVVGGNQWDSDWAMVKDPSENYLAEQWDYFCPTKVWAVNVNTGERRYAGDYMREVGAELSPDGRYIAWFADRSWHVYDIAADKAVAVGQDVEDPLWDTYDEHPSPSQPWGIAGWSKNDGRMLVYDRCDIWSLDPKGQEKSENLTRGVGNERGVRIRYINTDEERRYLSDGDLMLLGLFDYKDKYMGLGWTRYGKPAAPKLSVLDGHGYSRVRQAKDAEVFSWQRGNFSEIPEIWLNRGLDFSKATQLTSVNDQLKDIRWGTARLERWYAYDGKPSEGVLYVPDDLDETKKYPMLCVFYETGSEDLYQHYRMEPSWSWVNYPFYVSRGYVVFVPDIHYTSGRPGEDAYNYVCSGAEEMCRRYPWIDKEKIGIDGQSWGGYQTAYLVTRTDMFACAGSGAPVANMTSAYGGIRWSGGDSRQAQYEVGQSRIGGTLWDMPEAYIQASPVFKADRVTTPLLIMHNDGDGAVPWYQGIEMFMALRRLQKPVWMLQYNGEAHNIKARKNRKDITKRLQQFFDHYLKGDPMPRWMVDGISPLRKGQEFGFGLKKE